jgi:hypothetical protein
LPKIYGGYFGMNDEEISDILGNNAERFYFNGKK